MTIPSTSPHFAQIIQIVLVESHSSRRRNISIKHTHNQPPGSRVQNMQSPALSYVQLTAHIPITYVAHSSHVLHRICASREYARSGAFTFHSLMPKGAIYVFWMHVKAVYVHFGTTDRHFTLNKHIYMDCTLHVHVTNACCLPSASPP